MRISIIDESMDEKGFMPPPPTRDIEDVPHPEVDEMERHCGSLEEAARRVQSLMDITGMSNPYARDLLRAHEWNVESAIRALIAEQSGIEECYLRQSVVDPQSVINRRQATAQSSSRKFLDEYSMPAG